MHKNEGYTRKLLPVLLAICLTTSVFAQKAVIATTDFTTGDLSAIDAITHVATNEQLLIHNDAKVRTYGDRVYVINRLGQDNIIVLSKDDLEHPSRNTRRETAQTLTKSRWQVTRRPMLRCMRATTC